jgi:uncharacterized protein (TIRG00374 family)
VKVFLQIIRPVITFALFCGLAWLIYSGLDWQSLKQVFLATNGYLLLGMMLAWSMLLLIRPWRLKIILGAMNPGGGIKYRLLVKANLLSVASNNLLPARAGDLLMLLMLSNSSVKLRHTFPAAVVEKVIDLVIALILFIGTVLVMPVPSIWITNSACMLLAGTFVVLASGWILVSCPAVLRLVTEGVFERFSLERRMRWTGVLKDIICGLSGSMRPLVLLKIFALSALNWWVTVVFFLTGVWSVGADISLGAAAFTAGAVSLSFLIPISPGGVGVFHATATVALSLFSVPLTQGMAFAMLAHGIPFLVSIIVGYAVSLISGLGIGFLTQTRKNTDG